MNNGIPDYFYGFPITPNRVPLKPMVDPAQKIRNVHDANAFAPTGGAREWQRNELLMRNRHMRELARIQSIDDGVTEVYYLYPVQKL